jgi:hypothetical protein
MRKWLNRVLESNFPRWHQIFSWKWSLAKVEQKFHPLKQQCMLACSVPWRAWNDGRFTTIVVIEWEVLDSMFFIGIQRSTDDMNNKCSTTGFQHANPLHAVSTGLGSTWTSITNVTWHIVTNVTWHIATNAAWQIGIASDTETDNSNSNAAHV